MDYKRLHRSKRDVMLGGVAAGIAEYFNLDPTIVRLVFVLLAIASAGPPMVLIYIILWVIIPQSSSDVTPPASPTPPTSPAPPEPPVTPTQTQ
jgi:phage shock protein C